MRQLVGFIAFLIAAGTSSKERLAGQDSPALHYASLAFEGGNGSLFDLVHRFDPVALTHPDFDNQLWEGSTNASAWLYPAANPPAPAQIVDSLRSQAYRALKRRFYFEHERGGDLLDLIPADDTLFDQLLKQRDASPQTVVRDIVLAVNRFFEPDCPDTERDAIHLWQSHRFDVRPPETFVALSDAQHSALSVAPPRFAPWVEAWLPPDQRLVRAFAITAGRGGPSPAILVIDRLLFMTLREAERGLGRSSWSRTATRKISRFVDRLHSVAAEPSDIEDVRVRNVSTNLDRRFEVQRSPAKYLL